MGFKGLFKKWHLELHWGLFKIPRLVQSTAASVLQQIKKLTHCGNSFLCDTNSAFLCFFLWKLHSQWGSLCSFLLTSQFCSSLDCLQVRHTDVSLESFSPYMTSQTRADLQRNLRLNFKTLFVTRQAFTHITSAIFCSGSSLLWTVMKKEPVNNGEHICMRKSREEWLHNESSYHCGEDVLIEGCHHSQLICLKNTHKKQEVHREDVKILQSLKHSTKVISNLQILHFLWSLINNLTVNLLFLGCAENFNVCKMKRYESGVLGGIKQFLWVQHKAFPQQVSHGKLCCLPVCHEVVWSFFTSRIWQWRFPSTNVCCQRWFELAASHRSACRLFQLLIH